MDEVSAARHAGPGSLHASPRDFGDEIAGNTFFSCSNKNEAFEPPRYGIAIVIIMFGTHPWMLTFRESVVVGWDNLNYC